MYNLFIGLGVGVAVGLAWTLSGWLGGWGFGLLLGTTVAVATFIVLSRRISKRIEPAFQQIQKQIQAGNSRLALKSLEALLPLARWQILLKGQLYAQMGSLCFTMGDDDRALEYLQKASARVPDSRMFLASLHYRRRNVEAAKAALEEAISYNKKQVILYNVYAWLLLREGDRDGAIEQLLRCLKKEENNESTKDNLERVQNGKRMNMKRFGMQWYGLQFEKLPASLRQGQAPQQARKGFRQRPKRRG